MSRGINKIATTAPRVIAGVGYVILSREQDRDQYVSGCFRNNRLTIISDQGEVIKNCFVTRSVWSDVQFPETIKDRGSLVAWINIPYQNKAIIIGVMNKKDELNTVLSEHIFKQERKSAGGVGALINGDGKTGTLTFIASGDDTDKGEIYLKALNEKQMAFMQLYVQGKVEFEVDKDLDFKIGNKFSITIKDEENKKIQALIDYTLGSGFNLLDEFNNNIKTEKDKVTVQAASGNKIYIKTEGNTSEPALLGDKVENAFEEIQRLLENMVQVLEASSAATYVLAPGVQAATKVWKNNLLLLGRKLKLIKSKNIELT